MLLLTARARSDCWSRKHIIAAMLWTWFIVFCFVSWWKALCSLRLGSSWRNLGVSCCLMLSPEQQENRQSHEHKYVNLTVPAASYYKTSGVVRFTRTVEVCFYVSKLTVTFLYALREKKKKACGPPALASFNLLFQMLGTTTLTSHTVSNCFLKAKKEKKQGRGCPWEPIAIALPFR